MEHEQHAIYGLTFQILSLMFLSELHFRLQPVLRLLASLRFYLVLLIVYHLFEVKTDLLVYVLKYI